MATRAVVHGVKARGPSLAAKATAHTPPGAYSHTCQPPQQPDEFAGRAVQSALSLGLHIVHGILAGPFKPHTRYWHRPIAQGVDLEYIPSRTHGTMVRLMVQDASICRHAYPSSHISANSRTQGHTGIDDDQKLMIHARN
jgi:hypothetical protein